MTIVALRFGCRLRCRLGRRPWPSRLRACRFATGSRGGLLLRCWRGNLGTATGSGLARLRPGVGLRDLLLFASVLDLISNRSQCGFHHRIAPRFRNVVGRGEERLHQRLGPVRRAGCCGSFDGHGVNVPVDAVGAAMARFPFIQASRESGRAMSNLSNEPWALLNSNTSSAKRDAPAAAGGRVRLTRLAPPDTQSALR